MNTKEFKRIARLLKEVYRELEKEAIEKGVDIFSYKYQEVVAQARERVLENAGFTLEEYRAAKEEYLATKKESQDIFDKVLNDGTLAVMKDTQDRVREIDEKHIPTSEEIKKLAHEVAQKYVVPPQITNEIVKETIIEKPRNFEIVKETTIKEAYDDKALLGRLNRLEKIISELNTPEKIDMEELREKLREEYINIFAELFEHNINILGMPNFRKLAMGLRQDIDTKIEGVNTHRITVSATEPSNPTLNDLWVDTS